MEACCCANSANNNFPGHWIGKGGSIYWRVKFPDLQSPNYLFLEWGTQGNLLDCIKTLVKTYVFGDIFEMLLKYSSLMFLYVNVCHIHQ